MGLLDGILGNVVGSALGSGKTPAAQSPLSAVLSGLAQPADSGVGTGPNMGISADQIERAFGASSLQGIASQLVMPRGQASSALAQILPELINQLTPQGQLPENHDELISKGLAMLRGSAV